MCVASWDDCRLVKADRQSVKTVLDEDTNPQPRPTFQPESVHTHGAINRDGSLVPTILRSVPKSDVLPPGATCKPGRKVVGVDGKWYDVTAFIDHHPGGDIIAEYIGKDASNFFWSYHPTDVLAKRKPCGTYKVFELNPGAQDAAEQEVMAFGKEMREKGWYATNYVWLARKYTVVALLLSAVFYLAWSYSVSGQSWRFWVGAIMLAGTWQQAGFLMHDHMHKSTFHNQRLDELAGRFFGTVIFGANSAWWRDEHFDHHLFTNTVVPGVAVSDPQMHEEVWLQARELFGFAPLHMVQRLLVRMQHILYLPIHVFFGRVAILIDSYRLERSAKEWVHILAHWSWIGLLVSLFPTWTSAFQFWYLGSCLEGVLHLQLLLSHYDKPFEEKDVVKHSGYFRRQAEAVKDVSCPRWMDWFHGGLNHHLAHHTFPLLPRYRLREASRRLHAIAAKHHIKVDSPGFFQANWDIILHLKQARRWLISTDIRS